MQIDIAEYIQKIQALYDNIEKSIPLYEALAEANKGSERYESNKAVVGSLKCMKKNMKKLFGEVLND